MVPVLSRVSSLEQSSLVEGNPVQCRGIADAEVCWDALPRFGEQVQRTGSELDMSGAQIYSAVLRNHFP